MKLLAFDTSTINCSICYYKNNNYIEQNITHNYSSKFILTKIKEVLAADNINDLDGIIYGKGPGAFTGVRVGVGVAQGLSLAYNIPTMGFSTLKVIEYGATKKYKTTDILTTIDARMGEIYYRYHNNEKLDAPQNIKILAKIGVGSGFAAYPNFIKCNVIDENFYPQANNLIKLALKNIDKLNNKIPSALYLRNSVVKNC